MRGKRMDQYQHRRHNKNLLMVHLIFATKYRKALLTGAIREDIKQLLFDISCEHHWYIHRMETDRDQVHILLQYNPSDSITAIAHALKQHSTWRIWQKHEHTLKRHYWKERTFWSDEYFAASVGQVSQRTIEHYIESQG